MPKRRPNPDAAKQQAVEEIAGLVDVFCREHLSKEYAELCGRLTEKLARKRPAGQRQAEHLGLWHSPHDWLGELP